MPDYGNQATAFLSGKLTIVKLFKVVREQNVTDTQTYQIVTVVQAYNIVSNMCA